MVEGIDSGKVEILSSQIADVVKEAVS